MRLSFNESHMNADHTGRTGKAGSERTVPSQNFVLNDAQWREFNRRLEDAPRDLPRLRDLLNSVDIFDLNTRPHT